MPEPAARPWLSKSGAGRGKRGRREASTGLTKSGRQTAADALATRGGQACAAFDGDDDDDDDEEEDDDDEEEDEEAAARQSNSIGAAEDRIAAASPDPPDHNVGPGNGNASGEAVRAAGPSAAMGRRRCRNMPIQLGEQVPLLIGPSRVAGWGAFAPRAVDKHEFLIEYRGELISHEEADRRGQVYDRRACSYLFNLNDAQVVDACRKGCRARFANHSDSANAATRILSVRGDHHIGIYSKKRIERGEEVFFDYRYDHDERQMHGFKQQRQRRARRGSKRATRAANDAGGGKRRATG